MNRPWVKNLWRHLRWPMAIGVLCWLIVPNLDGLRELVRQGVAWRWIAAAVACRFLSLALTGYRWNMLLAGQDIRPPKSRVARMVGVGYVCNFVLPGTIGGDVAKAGLIAAETPTRRKRALATVPLDRGLGMLAFVILGSIAGLLRWTTIPSPLLQTAVLLMAGISACGLISLAVVTCTGIAPSITDSTKQDHATPLQKLLQTVRQAIAMLRRARLTVWLALLLGIVAHCCLCSASYCCLMAFTAAEMPFGWVDQLWLVPSAEVPTAFLSLPGGLGAREGALAYFYGEFASTPAQLDRFRDIGVLVGGCYSMVCICLAVGVAGVLMVTGRTWSEDGAEPAFRLPKKPV